MNESLLKKRLTEAPRMEPTDAVKLVYQNVFGCGHLISDENVCAEWLKAETAITPPEPDAPATTLIGNGLCRLNLASPSVRAIQPERLAAMMRLTAEEIHGETAAFEAGLEQLHRLAQAGLTPFSPSALEGYLTPYRAMGCPPARHSQAYRDAYHPAYRVLMSDFAVLLPLIAAIDQRIATAGSCVCVLDGSCGAGKTTLARRLAGLYDAPVIHMDDFFLPYDLRTPARLAEPGGNIHYERFLAEALTGLNTSEAFDYQRFDCATGMLLPRRCPAAPLRLVEGSYALHPLFLKAYGTALTAFVAVQEAAQLNRLAQRCPELLPRFEREWIPLEKTYFQAYDIKGQAKFILNSLPWEGDL